MTERTPKNWAYYNKMRREQPRQYYKTNIQRQVLADRNALGKEAFYSEVKKPSRQDDVEAAVNTLRRFLDEQE